jgi:hypothetical protein
MSEVIILFNKVYIPIINNIIYQLQIQYIFLIGDISDWIL